MAGEVLRRLVERGDRDRQRQADQAQSIKATEYIGNGYVKQIGQAPTRSRYLGNAGLVPGELVAPLGHGQQDVIIHKKPAPFFTPETIEEELFIEITIVLSYSIIPEYEFDGTNVLDAFQINIEETINNVTIVEEIAIVTPFAWVPVGDPVRTPNRYSNTTTFSQSNTLNGTYTNTLIGFNQPVQVTITPIFERYDWASGRGFDGNISGSSSIDGSQRVEVAYRARILTLPIEDINLVIDGDFSFASISVSDKITRNRNITINLFHSIFYSSDILNTWNLSSTLSGSFLPNPQSSLEWQHSDNLGWIYWLKILRGIDTSTAYSDQYFFGFQGASKRLSSTKVYGKRTFIDGSIQYAEGETYEELVYTESVIILQDFRDNPNSHLLLFT